MILFISTPEILFAIFIAILIFGTDKIPEIARMLGKGMRQLRDATNEIKNEINKSAKENPATSVANEVTEELEKVSKEINELKGSVKRSN